jgi:hypothetical protein
MITNDDTTVVVDTTEPTVEIETADETVVETETEAVAD